MRCETWPIQKVGHADRRGGMAKFLATPEQAQPKELWYLQAAWFLAVIKVWGQHVCCLDVGNR